jgi:hypothetical protein
MCVDAHALMKSLVAKSAMSGVGILISPRGDEEVVAFISPGGSMPVWPYHERPMSSFLLFPHMSESGRAPHHDSEARLSIEIDFVGKSFILVASENQPALVLCRSHLHDFFPFLFKKPPILRKSTHCRLFKPNFLLV